MTVRHTICVSLAGLLAGAMLAPVPATAANFYDGKTVTVINGYDAGSGADTITRIFTRHWEKQLKGVSSMIVRNMTGAGGAKALNFIYESARPDGFTIAFQPWNPIGFLTKAPGSRADYTKMPLIGGGSVAKIAYASAKTIKEPADFLKKRIKLAGSHPTANLDLISRSALEVMGVNYSYVSGYNSSSKSSLDVERGEIDLDTASGPFFARRVQPALWKKGVVVIPWYYPTVLADGTIRKIKYLEDLGIPSFDAVYRQLKGKDPSGPEWELFKFMQILTGNMLFAAFAPPGTPDAALAELRTAFTATTKDSAYLKDAAKFGEIQFATVEEGLGVIDSLRNTSPAILKAVNDFIASAER